MVVKYLGEVNVEGKSDAFVTFLNSFNIRDRVSLETLHLGALMSCEGSELEDAKAILLEVLKKENDPRFPRAIAAIDFKEALYTLREYISIRNGATRVEIADAIYQFTGDETVIDYIIDVLKNGNSSGKDYAALSLRYYKGEKVEKALLSAFEDEEKSVRQIAQVSYFYITGLSKWMAENRRDVYLIEFCLSSKLKIIREKAKSELVKIVRAKKKGKTAKELGISTRKIKDSKHLQDFTQSYLSKNRSNWPEHYDLDSYDKMNVHEKKWSEYVCYSNIEDKDFRAIGALLHMRAKLASSVFKEALPNSEGRLLVELIYGLWVLDKNKNNNNELISVIESSDNQRTLERSKEVYNTIYGKEYK